MWSRTLFTFSPRERLFAREINRWPESWRRQAMNESKPKKLESYFFSDADKLRLVFLNGEFLKTTSEIKDCPKGVELKNEDGGVLLSVPDDTCLRVTPIHILFFVSPDGKEGVKVSPHLNFSLGERSSVSVV